MFSILSVVHLSAEGQSVVHPLSNTHVEINLISAAYPCTTSAIRMTTLCLHQLALWIGKLDTFCRHYRDKNSKCLPKVPSK